MIRPASETDVMRIVDMVEDLRAADGGDGGRPDPVA